MTSVNKSIPLLLHFSQMRLSVSSPPKHTGEPHSMIMHTKSDSTIAMIETGMKLIKTRL